jgi:sec-independent protein translocase protein TatC
MSSSLAEHIAALRKALIHCIAAVFVLFPVGFYITPHCIDALVLWTFPKDIAVHLNYFSPMEVFILQLKLGGIIAFAIAFPYCLWHISKFLMPALYESERKVLKYVVIFSSFLFLLGASFCIYFMLPLVMKFSVSFATPQLQPMIGIGNFMTLCGWLILAFSLMFQFPLVVVAAVRFGIISAKTIKDKRPYIIVLIFFLAALLTPPDVVSQILLAIPTWILFEIGLFFAFRLENKNAMAKDEP